MIDFYTYLHCKPDGSPFYVGKGYGTRSHQFGKGRRSLHHQNIVAKYGKENIGVFVFPCESEEQAFSDEIQQIAQLRREGYELCNKTNGGEGTSGMKVIHTPETIAKMSAVKKGKKASYETKAKMSAARKGRKMPEWFGPSVSKRNMGNKYGLGNKNASGKPTEQAIANRAKGLKESWKNRVNRTHSPETKAKIAEIQRQRWADGKYQSRSAMNRKK